MYASFASETLPIGNRAGRI